MKKNIFNPGGQSAPLPAGELPISSLPFRLVGTILSNVKKDCVAILESGASKEQNLYRIGDALSQGATISKVNRLDVVVNNNGRFEKIVIDYGEGPNAGGGAKGKGSAFGALAAGTQVAMAGDQVLMDKRYFEAQKGNMNDMMTQIRAVPNAMPDGAINGFQVFEIVKDSIYDKVGLKNQDVVQKINGQPLNSVQGGLDLFNALKNDNHFVVDIVRNNQSKTITVDIQ